jgi:hypothetical protein
MTFWDISKIEADQILQIMENLISTISIQKSVINQTDGGEERFADAGGVTPQKIRSQQR